MLMFKEFYYDLGGYNQQLFWWIYQLRFGELYDRMVSAITLFGDREYIIYWLLMVSSLGIITWGMGTLRGHVRLLQVLRLYVGVTVVMLLSYALNGTVIDMLKTYFSFPRPFVELAQYGVQQIHIYGPYLEEYQWYRSMPSGHSAFIMVMIASLWPLLGGGLSKFVGLFLILGVMWSRVSLGVHYPMDTVYGALVGFIAVTVVRFVVGIFMSMIPVRSSET